MENLKKNQIFTTEIDGYSAEGFGVCHINGRAVFVPKTIKGETCEIKILKVTNAAVYGRLEKIIYPSEHRIEPVCPHFGKCGGCDCMHMSYEEELRFKLDKLNSALKHVGRQNYVSSEIIGSDQLSAYRNKGIFNIAEINGRPEFGFYRERSHELIKISSCYIQKELSCRAARAVCDFMAENNIKAYDENSGRGTVRHVFCRQAVHEKAAVLCIISNSGFGSKTDALVAYLRKICPELTGIVLNINKSRGNSVLSGDFYTLWGDSNICDSLLGVKFNIAPQAFFQINPQQAEKLYSKAIEYADISSDDLVFDLYCGAGTISLCMAKKAGRVIGAEIIPEAVVNAGENAGINGIENAEFICADAGEAAENLASRGLKPKVVVVDPPRKGMFPNAIDAVASMNPQRIVYVSCNPATLARDVLRFSDLGYELKKAAALDMFPRTAHVETVVLLSKGEIDSKKVKVEISMEDVDLSDFRKDATYPQIKEYVLNQTGLKVSSLYISQIKRKCGLEVGQSYNKPKSEDAKQPQCPPEKEKAIMDALKHFGMI